MMQKYTGTTTTINTLTHTHTHSSNNILHKLKPSQYIRKLWTINLLHAYDLAIYVRMSVCAFMFRYLTISHAVCISWNLTCWWIFNSKFYPKFWNFHLLFASSSALFCCCCWNIENKFYLFVNEKFVCILLLKEQKKQTNNETEWKLPPNKK